jgi:hypothetical protein
MSSSPLNTQATNETIEATKQISKSNSPAIKTGWLRAILGFIFISILSGLTAIPLFISGILTSDSLDMPMSELFNQVGINTILLSTFLQLIGALIAIFILCKYIDKKRVKSLGFELSNYKKDLLKGFFWGAGLIFFGFLVLYLGNYITIIDTNFSTFNWLSYIALFAVVAINEEIIVRGYVLSNLMASMNKYWALLASAVLFSAMHLGNENSSLLSTINILLAGILLGIYTIHTRNLWFPIMMHFAWNFFQGPVLGFEVSGIKMESVIDQKITGNPLITGGDFGFEGSLLLTVMMVISTIYLHLKYRGKDITPQRRNLQN